MKLNNKGFTLIEILATVAIMSILFGVAIIGVSKYIEKTQRDAYETMQKTVYDAAASYHQNNPTETTVDIGSLLTYGYLETLKDPTNKSTDCEGTVTIVKTAGSGTKLDSYEYKVELKCSKYNTTKSFYS